LRSRQKQYPHKKRPTPETGSSREAEVFPRRIGEEVFASFSEPACVRARFVRGGE
jgi:hypothetical protein